MINVLVNKITTNVEITTNGIIEFYVLSKINNIPIVVRDVNDEIINVYHDGFVENTDKYKKDMEKYINIKYTLVPGSDVPIKVESEYYKQ